MNVWWLLMGVIAAVGSALEILCLGDWTRATHLAVIMMGSFILAKLHE